MYGINQIAYRPILLLLVILLLSSLGACAGASPASPVPAPKKSLGNAPYISVVDLPTRPDVTQRMLLMVPHYPRAVLLLLPGGDGELKMDSLGLISQGEDGFLVRAAAAMVGYQMAVAVPDAPSDCLDQDGFSGGFRCSTEHGRDLDEILIFLRDRWPKLPLWAVGFDDGAISAASTALAQRDDPVDGLVMGAVKILPEERGCSLSGLALEEIEASTLMLQHEQDACPGAALKDAGLAASRLDQAREVELLAVSGGSSPGPPCSSRSYHGFWGREKDVADSIVRWIISTLPEKPADPEEGEAK